MYAVAAFWNLGSAHDPQRFCSFEAGESAVLALERETAVAAVWYYPGLSTGEYTLAYSTDGVTFTPAGTMPQGYADLFKWLQPQTADTAPATAAYVRITAGAHMELGELALYDLQGDRIGVRAIAGPADADALCDEADTVPASSTYYNSTYFDEIYHARTAYEHLRGVYPYEVSHPPLGKGDPLARHRALRHDAIRLALHGRALRRGHAAADSGTCCAGCFVTTAWPCAVRRCWRATSCT